MRLLAEDMAALAFTSVQNLQLDDAKLGEVTSVAKRVPALLVGNGLAATLTTMADKDRNGWPEYVQLVRRHREAAQMVDDISSLGDLSAPEYLRRSTVMAEWVGWLKRALVAEGIKRHGGGEQERGD